MGQLQVGEIVHLSDLKLPEGVTSTALALGDDRDIGVASVLAPRGGKGAEDAEDEVDDTESTDDAPSEDAGEES